MPIIDIHAHFGSRPVPTQTRSLDAIDQYLQRFGIEKACFASVEALAANFVHGNARLFKEIAGHDRFLGYCVVNPNYVEESIEEMKKYMGKSQCFGLKIHTGYMGRPLNCEPVKEILNASRRYGKPVLTHGWDPADCLAVGEVAREFTTLKFILAHVAGPTWQPTLEMASEILNLYLEPCSSGADRDKVAEAHEAMGSKRVLFGSDLMLVNPAFVAGMVRGAAIPERDKERILYHNAKEAFAL